MSESSTPRYPAPELSTLPDDVRARIEEVQAKAGFIPNVFAILARRPAEFRAFFDYHDALMEREACSLTRAEREMIVVATSAANQCEYCVIAHGALVRIYAKKPLLADQIAVNYRTADLSPRERAILDFAVKVAVDPASLDADDYARLHEQGLDDEAVWDIGAITAFFGLSNRLASVTGMRANDEFYLLGRVPRSR